MIGYKPVYKPPTKKQGRCIIISL
ncbi:hypothetical protein FLM49_15525 [Neptunomonas phycophila]|nr:hypothetical protein FLM49_15525 [Neptunomonas phycophila]